MKALYLLKEAIEFEVMTHSNPDNELSTFAMRVTFTLIAALTVTIIRLHPMNKRMYSIYESMRVKVILFSMTLRF